MCAKTPKPPSQQPLIDEERRQFEIEQERLAEQERLRQAEAERQRELEEQRVAEQRRIEEERLELERRRQEEAALQQARIEEAARQRELAIAAGTEAVNTGFKQFDDGYFDAFRKDYLEYYNPRIDEQAAEAREDTEFELARRGGLDSSAATKAYGRLNRRVADERGRIGREAVSATDSFRNAINQLRTDLVGQVVASEGQGDFVALTNDAVGTVSRPSFQPLGDLFAGMVGPEAPAPAGGGAPQSQRFFTDGLTATPASEAARLVEQQKRAATPAAAAAGQIF